MNHLVALQQIEKFHKVFKAFEEAKEAITALASLEQNVKELTKSRETEIQMLEIAKANLEEYRNNAIEEQERILNEFKNKTSQAKSRSEKNIANLEEKFKQDEETIKTILSSIQDKILAARVENNILDTEIRNKKQELSSLEDKITEARKQITNILKG